jgi:hypothetical protein
VAALVPEPAGATESQIAAGLASPPQLKGAAMAEEKLYRANWLLKGHNGKTVLPNETISLPPEEAEALGDVLSPVDEEPEKATATGKTAKAGQKGAESKTKSTAS